jgi:eukaryotic-like serine/threonine-protein kinase
MSQTPVESSLIGRELGHYRVIEKIGEGGMGEVFLAHDQHLGHEVALKVLPPGTDDRSRHLFRKEAHAISKLNHPNIVTVIDFDTQGDLSFLVMEYVQGLALDEKVRQGLLAEEEIVRIGLQLAGGLTAAHEQGVIHRDVKPGNLRLTSDDRLKILDFGLARSTLSFGPLASTASCNGLADCSGTLPYMGPEQLLGQAADARTDIYSAGAVLYELWTGHPPFEHRLFSALVDEILHAAPVPPSRVRPGISRRLEAIISRCLEKDPANRFQSAKELGQSLGEVAASEVLERSSRSRYLAVATLLFLALLVLFVGYGRRRLYPLIGRRMPQIESLAVLPFANLSGDPQQEYLADSMTDFVITDLGQMHALRRVISRTSVLRYKTERLPMSQVARQLNVDAIVEGSVTRSGKTVQVTVRLINAPDDRQLWSHSYESEFRDLLILQHQLALAIAREIRSNLPVEALAGGAAARSVDPGAQEAYLNAKYLSFGTSEQRAKARQYFEKAIQLDPNYAAAYAGLADSYWSDIGMPARDTMPKAREYALKAISLDENLAHAHTALATVRFYGDWDWAAADQEYRHALQLNPSDAEGHRMYSVFLAAMDRTDESLAQVLAVQEIDPLYSGNNSTAGWDLYCARRYDQAVAECQKAVELAPNHEVSHSCLAYGYLGEGRYKEAIEESKKAWLLSNKQTVWLVLLGRAYALGGDDGHAREMLDELLRRRSQTYVPPYFVATLYAALGQKERALSWLDKAYTERDLYVTWIKVDSALDSLRPDARFQDLLQRMGFAL